jgi:hypothetical protein
VFALWHSEDGIAANERNRAEGQYCYEGRIYRRIAPCLRARRLRTNSSRSLQFAAMKALAASISGRGVSAEAVSSATLP